ncbi:MAG: hypothetical protein HGA54_06540, partial [Actinobacteria bacterium]|nr:hypothetical protein [Actinomycetota bacterium]
DIYFCGTGAGITPLIAVIDAQTDVQTHKIDELVPPDVAGSESLSSCALALGMAINA